MGKVKVNKPTLVTRETKLPSGWGYSVMRKLALSLSSILLIVFIFGHWAGNLNLLKGEAVFNDYILWLNNHLLLHYGVLIALLLAVMLHTVIGLIHYLHNRRSGQSRYHHKRYLKTNIAARSMIFTGAILLLFILVHIAHMRGWLLDSSTESSYQNLHLGLQILPLFSLYLLGQFALAFHLYHGVWSLFQTLGIYHPRYNHWRRPFAVFVAISIALLNGGLVLLNSEISLSAWRLFYDG